MKPLKRYSKAVKIIYIVWIIIGTLFILKLSHPLITRSQLQENYYKTYEEKIDGNSYSKIAYHTYKDYDNSLKESDDPIYHFYFNLNRIIQIFIIVIALFPYILVAIFYFIKIENYYENSYIITDKYP